MAFDIIDRVPKILLDDPVSKSIDLSNVRGNLELKNVTFRYPSKMDQLILDNFSAVFEEGRTTALVGASGSGKSTII